MYSKDYTSLYKKIMPNYEKWITLDLDKIKIVHCISNINSTETEFHSDIKEVLEIVLEELQ